MYKLSVALLFAAAATSTLAMSDPPAENRADTQHRPTPRVREGAASTHVRAGTGERRVVNNPSPMSTPVISQGSGAPAIRSRGAERRVLTIPSTVAPNPTQGSRPEFRRRAPVGGVEQRGATPLPNVENRRTNRAVTQLPNIQGTHPPVVSRTPRLGTEPPLRAERARPQWNRNWRSNRGYDWNGWRQRNRTIFHVRPYRDPYGWAYQLFSIGWRLWPQYYVSSYWIYDPSMYRLPPAPPGTRWIRYYNDALLVDMYTGEVIDVIHDFFW